MCCAHTVSPSSPSGKAAVPRDGTACRENAVACARGRHRAGGGHPGLVTAGRRPVSRSAAAAGQAEASWRERALNAEDALSQAYTEILTQRRRIDELAGTIRDLETPLSTGSAQRITAENTTLHHRIRQLADVTPRSRAAWPTPRCVPHSLPRPVTTTSATTISTLPSTPGTSTGRPRVRWNLPPP